MQGIHNCVTVLKYSHSDIRFVTSYAAIANTLYIVYCKWQL